MKFPFNNTKKSLALISAVIFSIPVAQADPPFTLSAQLVISAVSQGRTIQGLGGRIPATFQAIAVPYRMNGDDCVNVGLIKIATTEIENWQYCRGSLERLPGKSPKLSPASNPQILEVITEAERMAGNNGQKTLEWGDYEVIARQLPSSSPKGCRSVESIVLVDGQLVSRRLSNVCQ